MAPARVENCLYMCMCLIRGTATSAVDMRVNTSVCVVPLRPFRFIIKNRCVRNVPYRSLPLTSPVSFRRATYRIILRQQSDLNSIYLVLMEINFQSFAAIRAADPSLRCLCSLNHVKTAENRLRNGTALEEIDTNRKGAGGGGRTSLSFAPDRN